MQAYRYIRTTFIGLVALAYHVTRFLSEQFPKKQRPDGSLTERLTPQTFRQPLVLGGGSEIAGQKVFDSDQMKFQLDKLPPEFERVYKENMEKLKPREDKDA